MNRSRRLQRILFSIFLISALCGNFALPVVSVSAAPPMQAPLVCNVPMTQWNFDNLTTGSNTTPTYSSIASDVTSATSNAGNGLTSPAISTTSSNSSPNNWFASGFATAATLTTANNDYFEFIIDTTNYSGVNLNFYALRSGQGPSTMQVYYSIDNSLFNPVAGTYTIGTAYPTNAFTADLTGLTNGTGTTYIRIYGWNSAAASGTLHLDDVTFNGCQPATPTPTATDTGTATSTPTNTGTPTSTPTFTSTATPTSSRSLIINEVAWGGTVASASDEWFELYNTTGTDINLAGWHLTADDGNPDIVLSGTITAGQFLVFAKNSLVFQNLSPAPKIYSSGSFSNNGEILYLNDPNGNQVDTANLDGGAWPAGSGAPAYASMERKGNIPDDTSAWSTYGGTGSAVKDRGGNSIMGTPGQANWITTITPTATPSITPTPSATPTATMTGTATAARSVIINEVAWSGTAANSNDEWIELHNTTSSPINITGWQLYADDNVLNKVGSPNITLSGTISAGGFFLLERDELATDVTANQVYSSGELLNTGERLYLKNGSTIVDTANLDGGSWPAGTAAATTTSTFGYASMERVESTLQWVTYNGTIPEAHDRNNNPIRGTPGKANWIASASVTTITSDLPDPSLVNGNVSVVVSVINGEKIPSGTVSITGANTNCTLTLSAGVGSCVVKFTSTGTKTLTATYSSTNGLPPSNDTEAHTVSTSTTIFHTPTPIPAPPPQLIAINEFVPRPGHDWNHDGVVNTGDEYIELLNHGTVDVNLSGWRLDDEVNVGSNPYSLPAKVLKPGERVVYYGSETGLLLSDGGDAVRLLKPNGQLLDAYNYSIASYPDQSFCRLPDNGGADDWNQNCYPTPGLQNSLNGNNLTPVKSISQETLCPIADTLPFDFVYAECDPFGINIFRRSFWDQTGWYNDKALPIEQNKWSVFAD